MLCYITDGALKREVEMGVTSTIGDTGSDADISVVTHSASQVLYHQDVHCGDFLYVNEKGVPRKLVRITGVDFLGKKITVEWIVGSTILTKNLDFSGYSLDGSHGDNWLKKAKGFKTGLVWDIRYFRAKPFDPDKIDPDYFP